ncbi:MAG TPA: hypothetical protein VFW28_12900 [Micropepsaceae bacterium]|nr:hypothetical protein [Micropepsaceae bacterium]
MIHRAFLLSQHVGGLRVVFPVLRFTLDSRKPDDPTLVTGASSEQRFLTVAAECAKAMAANQG